jgi:hypothetical protein
LGTMNPVTAVLSASATRNGTEPISLVGANNDKRETIEKLVNISTRGPTSQGDNVMIAGFVVHGTHAKQLLIRCVGPTLDEFGVADVLPAARLQLYSGPVLLAEADDWGTASNIAEVLAAAQRVYAFDLPFTSRDSVMLVRLQPGTYTIHARGQDAASGVCLVEVYDATDDGNDPPEQRLVNISTRGPVGMGDAVMIAGFVVRGDVPQRVLVRGIGPGLDSFMAPAPTLDDPSVTLFDRNGREISANDNWNVGNDAGALKQAAVEVNAFPLAQGSKDAAMLLSLDPGSYTAHLRGVGNLTGIGLIEIYEVP